MHYKPPYRHEAITKDESPISFVPLLSSERKKDLAIYNIKPMSDSIKELFLQIFGNIKGPYWEYVMVEQSKIFTPPIFRYLLYR